MNKKYRFFVKCVFVFSLICINFCIVGCSNQNEVEGVTPKHIISSNNLLEDFTTNEQVANKKYIDEVIEVYGKIKEITLLNDRKTIILQTNTDSGIICDINDKEQEKIPNLKKNQLIHIKGICKGYLKDVILLNCFIDLKNQHE